MAGIFDLLSCTDSAYLLYLQYQKAAKFAYSINESVLVCRLFLYVKNFSKLSKAKK